MFLRCSTRKKDGKKHHYWSLVENRRLAECRVVQRHVLYLGEINDSQQVAWRRSIEIFDQGEEVARTVALVAAERQIEQDSQAIVRIRVDEMELRRPRQWGGCWLACELYHQLELDQFFSQRLPANRKGTRWDLILQTLVCYRLLDPGSEWRLHREWFLRSAMADLLASDFSLAESHKLYRVHDLLLPHKAELFSHLQQRWKDLFGARFEVLLYDLTSTYFESDPAFEPVDKRKFGYSRDKRNDCVQVIIALVVTPEGFPIAYEVLAGNTADKTTLGRFLQKLEAQLLEQPWNEVRAGVEVKLLAQEKELYLLAQSRQRLCKERAIRRRRLKKLWRRLAQLRQMHLSRDQLLIKLGQAKEEAGRVVWKLIPITVAQADSSASELLSYRLDKERLRVVRRREGRYLLRSNLIGIDPAQLWELYIQLTQIEEAFRNLKGDLAIRPIYHQLEERIEAHIFVAFIAYCLHVTLRRRLHKLAPGLTPRAVLEKFKTIQMIDVHLPTTDGRTVILPRYTQPEQEHRMLLHALNLELPAQPKPRITAAGKLAD